jgi:hypothetical protein
MLVRRLEVLIHRLLEIVVAIVGVHSTRLLGVRVEVDGDELIELQQGSASHVAT